MRCTHLLPVMLIFLTSITGVHGQSLFTADNIFPELLENRANPTGGYAIFEMVNPSHDNIDLSSYNLRSTFITTNRRSPNLWYEWFVNATVTFYEDVQECRDTVIQGKNGSITVPNCMTYSIKKEKEGFVPLSSKEFKPGEKVKIKLVAHWKARIGNQAIDWIPELTIGVYTYKQTKWAWWNFTIENKIQITVTNNAGAELKNYLMLINSSSDLSKGFNTASLIADGKMQADCDDMWLVDSGETNTLAHYIENGTCNTANTMINSVVNLTTGANTFYIYFNVPTETNHENRRDVLAQLPGDWADFDFDEGTGTTIKDGGLIANNGTLSNAGFVSSRGYGLGLINTDYANLTTRLSNGTRLFTMELWMKPGATQGAEVTVFSDQGTGAQGMAFEKANINGSGTSAYMFLVANAAGNDWNFMSPFIPATDAWNHIYFVLNGTNATIYLNGTSVTSRLYGGTAMATQAAASFFGDWRIHNRDWNGTIDDFSFRMGYAGNFAEAKADYDGLAWSFGAIQSGVCWWIENKALVIPKQCAYVLGIDWEEI